MNTNFQLCSTQSHIIKYDNIFASTITMWNYWFTDRKFHHKTEHLLFFQKYAWAHLSCCKDVLRDFYVTFFCCTSQDDFSIFHSSLRDQPPRRFWKDPGNWENNRFLVIFFAPFAHKLEIWISLPPQRDVDNTRGSHSYQQQPPFTEEIGDRRHHHVAQSRAHKNPKGTEDDSGFGA